MSTEISDFDPLRERQDRRMRQLLLELELVSHGTITAYNSSGGSAASVKALPPGESSPPHLRYRTAYNEAADDRRRWEVISEARVELESITRRLPTAPRGLSDAEVLIERVLELESWSANTVAMSLRCATRVVRRIRTDAGRDGETGKVLDLTAVDRADLAARMQDEHKLNQAEVAKRMGISQQTVSRLLRTRPRKVAA
jgi:hypothetical protein